MPKKHSSAPGRLETVASPIAPSSQLTKVIPKNPTSHRVVFCFGRFQPPTIGHRFVFETVRQYAQQADYFIIPSANCDAKPSAKPKPPTLSNTSAPAAPAPPTRATRSTRSTTTQQSLRTSARSQCAEVKNPLTLTQRIYYLKKMYPDDHHRILDIRKIAEIYHEEYEGLNKAGKKKTTAKSFVTAVRAFARMGYTDIFQVFGGKEYKDFKTTFKPSVQKDLDAEFGAGVVRYDLTVLEREEGDTSPTSKEITVANVSGTKLRNAIKHCDHAVFAKGIPEPTLHFTARDRLKLFYALRRAYGKTAEGDMTECPPPPDAGMSPKAQRQFLESAYRSPDAGAGASGGENTAASRRSKRSTMVRKDSTNNPAK